MSESQSWLAALATVAILLAYEAALWLARKRRPGQLARTAHAALREAWFQAASLQKGSEILAVQTLRNAMMSATMMASTAVLALMGSVTLAAPSLRSGTAALRLTPQLGLELLLMAMLFASLVCSAMAVRYYNHAGFIAAMPVDSDTRRHWSETGAAYLRRAGLLYSWGLRHLVLIAPLLASLLHPGAGPLAALLVVLVMHGFDRFSEG